MAKRPVMDVSELIPSNRDTGPATRVGQGFAPAVELASDEEEFENLYCRIPRSLFRKLRKRSWELSENRRKRVTVTQLVELSIRRYLDESDGAL
jgi:hypothetical protein